MQAAPVLSTEPEYAKVECISSSSLTPEQIATVYSTEQIAEIIRTHNFTTPCIQFSDNLVHDAAKIATSVEAQLEAHIKVYCLADTSYSPCCVDEIAAQHVNADVLFHLGNACLNPVSNLPVYYVIHQPSIDVDLLRERIKSCGPCIVYADTEYTNVLPQVANEETVLAYPSRGNLVPAVDLPQDHVEYNIPNRVLSPRKTEEELEKLPLVYLSSKPSESLMLYLSTVFSSISVIDIESPDMTVEVPTQFLRKRYRYVQMAKAAGTIGILVNTLSLRHMTELLELTKKWISAADKKYYTFVVGKPNVPKLANFEVIDIWVVLGCPLGGMIVDSSEYYKPVITPYELKMALTFDWNGQWVIDLESLIELDVESDESKDVDTDEPYFDPVTGKFAFNNAPLRKYDADGTMDKELVEATQALTIKNTSSTAAEYLQSREWRGLGSDLKDNNEEFAVLKKGRSGIARDYKMVE